MGMKRVLKLVLSIVISATFLLSGLSAVLPASAMTLREGAEAARCDECPTDLFGDNGVFKQVSNTVLFIVGVVAVIMLIIGGIKYVVSGGDAKKVTDAKNTVLYAIIGLVIAFFAFAIVNFVISSLPSSEETAALIQTYC